MCESPCVKELSPGLEIIKLEYSLKIKRIDWLLADTWPVLYDRFNRLTLFIMMVLPMHVDRISMELPMLYFTGLQHFICVGTVCQNTCPQVSRIKIIINTKPFIIFMRGPR